MQDFHFQEISKNPDSIHAIYLITGRRKVGASAENERCGHDDDMNIPTRSSPFLSSSVLIENKVESQITCIVMSLVSEDNLEGKLKFGETQTSVILSTKFIG